MESLVREQLVLWCATQLRPWSVMYDPAPGGELWTAMLNNGSPVDAIYLDFQKTFDIVPHHERFPACGIDDTTRNWIRAILTGGKQ